MKIKIKKFNYILAKILFCEQLLRIITSIKIIS